MVAEVELLLRYPTKANTLLGVNPTQTSFETLVKNAPKRHRTGRT